MKTYLEIIELPDTVEKTPQIIRLEVADKDDAISRLSVFEPLFEGVNYVKQVHYCKHEEKEKCVIEVL